METITLKCDKLDATAIRSAIAHRERIGPLPDSDSSDANEDGRVVAEICRGWMEWLRLDWHKPLTPGEDE